MTLDGDYTHCCLYHAHHDDVFYSKIMRGWNLCKSEMDRKSVQHSGSGRKNNMTTLCGWMDMPEIVSVGKLNDVDQLEIWYWIKSRKNCEPVQSNLSHRFTHIAYSSLGNTYPTHPYNHSGVLKLSVSGLTLLLPHCSHKLCCCLLLWLLLLPLISHFKSHTSIPAITCRLWVSHPSGKVGTIAPHIFPNTLNVSIWGLHPKMDAVHILHLHHDVSHMSWQTEIILSRATDISDHSLSLFSALLYTPDTTSL